MNWVILFFLSSAVLATDCALYELQGQVIRNGLTVSLIVNEDSNSQRGFKFGQKISLEMAPYFDRTVRGQFVTKKLEILKIEKVEIAVPDPLYRSGEMIKSKSVPCPK